MALSKTAKTWLIILGTLVVLFVGAIAGLKMYFTSERLKAFIIPKIEDATHHTVNVGDVSLSLLPSISITVENLRISNPKGMTFDKGEFASFDRLVLSIKLWSLFKNKLDINTMLVEQPVLYLEVKEDGTSNYGTPPSETEGGETKVKVTVEEGAGLLLSNFEVKNGSIEMVDKQGSSRMKLEGYNQTASVEMKSGEKIFHITANASIEKVSYGTLSLWYLSDVPLTATAALTYDMPSDKMTFDNVTMKLKDLPLTVSGSLSQLTQDVRDIDMIITSPGVQMSQLLSIIPPDMLKAASGMTSSGDVKFEMTVKGSSSLKMTPETKGTFSVANGNIQYASLPKAITNINLSGTFERPQAMKDVKGIGAFAIEKMTASLGTSTITARMKVKNFDDPLVNATVSGSMNLNEVKDYYPLEPGTDVSGTMKINVSLDGKSKEPTSMKAIGSIEFANVTIKTPSSPRSLQHLNGTIRFNNYLLESKQLAMNIGESDLSMAFTMKNYLGLVMEDAKKAGKPSASITLTSKQLRTADLISEEKFEAGKEQSKQPQQAAMLPGIDVDANVSIGKLVTEKFEFTNARGSVSLAHGIATLRNFSVNAFNGTIVSKGTLDLRDMKKRPFDLNLDIVGVESHEFLSKFTSFGNNLYGKFTMNSSLKGDLNDTLGLNTQTLAGNGNVQLYDGKLVGFALLAKIADYTGLNELREVAFNNWSNVFTVADGKMTINNLSMKAASTDFIMSGTQGLDGTMDQTLSVKLSQTLSNKVKLPGVGEQLIQFFKDNDGRITLNFAVTGPINNPAIKLDTRPQEEMAKKAAAQELEKLKKKGEEELKKKAEEGLKKLLKKP
jgi:uncharacterized protein involved in outer membrane biogenesis